MVEKDKNKVRPNYDYECEAYDGKNCCLVLDEECHYKQNSMFKKIRESAAKKAFKGTKLGGLLEGYKNG